MKSIYDEALEDLSILVKQANARKLSNDIVVNRWGLERIEKIINQAQKQEKLLELYKELATVRGDMLYCYEVVDFIAYNAMEKKETQLEKQIKEIENEINL